MKGPMTSEWNRSEVVEHRMSLLKTWRLWFSLEDRCGSHQDLHEIQKKSERYRDFDCSSSSRRKGFKSLDGPHLVYSFFVLVIAHSWGQEMRLTFWPGTTKTRIETLGDLNEPIRVTINFSLLPRYREIDGTRYAVPSRSSGFPVMWSLVLLSRILCLRYHDEWVSCCERMLSIVQ